MAIVHDESITYGILLGDPTFAEQANNHWLNTWLMRVSRYFFGDSEFALRMPNVLAFPIYAAAVGLTLWRLRFAAQALGVALLVGNPFVLEFFGLARGYGLSLAFVAVLAAAIVAKGHQVARLAVGTAAGVLAFYASFGSLNVVLAGIGVLAVVTVRRRSLAAIPLLGVATLLPGLVHVKEMQDAGLLYVGGNRGFVADTIGSVLRLSSGWGPERAWLPVAQCVVVGAALACLVDAVRRRQIDGAAGMTAMTGVAVMGQFAASILFDSLWPQDVPPSRSSSPSPQWFPSSSIACGWPAPPLLLLRRC